MGLSQLITGAAKDCHSAGLIGDRVDPQFSLYCGAWIMARGYNIFTDKRTLQCRLELASLSYLSGAGHIISGQKIAAREGVFVKCVPEILPYMPIHEANKVEGKKYVTKINRLESEMTGGK